jgi:DNA replication protein DnaC
MADEPRSDACARCLGRGFVYENVDGREQVRPCACHRGFLARPQDPLEACRIPSVARRCTLGNFVPRSPGQQHALDCALAYCNRFPHAGAAQGIGLLFWGPRGTGKTHLGVGLLQELVSSKKISGRFWDFGVLLKEISRSYDKNSLTTVMDPLQAALDVDLLLLDDLASRRMPDWAHNTLFDIVNARYMARRATLVTTAWDDADRDVAMDAHPMRRREFLIDRIGQRVRSRLLEMCVFVPMQEPEHPEAPRRSFPPSTLAGMRRRSGNS